MAQRDILQIRSKWSSLELRLFRFFFIYFFVQVLPLDASFWQHLFATNWLNPQYRDIFYLSRYQPQFLPGGPSFANWGVVALIAFIGTLIWGYRDGKREEYDRLYYILRVLVRYRLALGVIAYGFLKLFPLQAPPPSISHLNTDYGDFGAWKLFALSLGVVPNYQSFLGLVEIAGGLLLLNRKTATIATLIILPFTGNVFFSNLAYEGGEYVYSAYLIALALFVFAYDGLRLFKALSLEIPTEAASFRPQWVQTKQKWTRLALKTAFILFFVIIYGFKTYEGYHQGQYHYPSSPGLAGTEGYYNVREFRLNNQTIPYSKTDPKRWQNVVFEKWNTVSIQSNEPVVIAEQKTEEIAATDDGRNFEYANQQGRHFYSYTFDGKENALRLTNRNPNHANDGFTLRLEKAADGALVLSGTNQKRDSLFVVLDKIDKKYLLFEAQKTGRRANLKL